MSNTRSSDLHQRAATDRSTNVSPSREIRTSRRSESRRAGSFNTQGIRYAASAVLVLIAVSGCATSDTTQPDSAPPANYRALARDYLRTSLFDPYSVRDAQIAPPQWGDSAYLLDPGPGWIICVRLNARNRMGAYTGYKEDALLVRGGKVTISSNAIGGGPSPAKIHSCRNAQWEPFPELSHDGR